MNPPKIVKLHATSSELSRLSKCPPSATLEPFGNESAAANEGSAGHEHFEDRAALGVDAAMARLPEVARRWFGNDERETAFFLARMRKLEWSPPKQSFGEVALALLDDGTVVRTVGGKGHYPELLPGGKLHGKAIFAGQNDVFWSSPEPLDLSDPNHPKCPPGSTLWVGDYKFGDDAFVDPIETNLQQTANAVMVAKWVGATKVVPFILYMRPPGGDWDVPSKDGEPVAWGPRGLVEAEQRVRRVLDARRRAIALHEAGEPVEGFKEGAWCGFCPGRETCPARIASLREVANMAMVPRKRGEGVNLTVDELRWLATRLPMIDSFVAKVREFMKEHVDLNGPIPFDDGTVWGPYTEKQEKLVASKALPILLEEFGEELYAQHFSLDRIARISKDAIDEVVKIDHEAKGLKRQRSSAMGRILNAVREKHGIESTTTTKYGKHRPLPVLEAKAEKPKLELAGMEIDGDEPEAAAE